MSEARLRFSAAQNVLGIPELLTMILNAERLNVSKPWNCFQRILSNEDLKNAMLVNQFWFEIASSSLWADQENILHLFHVPLARRQIYASKMTRIEPSGKHLSLYYDEYRHLEFGRLKRVFIRLKKLCAMKHVEPFLVPSLQSFIINGESDLQPEVFSHLAIACPNLREFKIFAHELNSPLTFESFSRFIRHARALKIVTVKLHLNWNIPASGELLSSLACSSSLEQLRLSCLWTESHSRQGAAAVSQSGVVPFPRIRRMNLNIEPKAIDKLVPLVANVTHLTLNVRDSTKDVLPHVSNLGNLESLSIHYAKPGSLPRESLLGLGALSRLSTLSLCSCVYQATGFNLVRSRLSDDDCEALASRLPNLQHLELRLRCDISTKTVESFARHCPNLQKCQIFQRLDTTNLFTSTSDNMVFPQLHDFGVGSLGGEAIMRSV